MPTDPKKLIEIETFKKLDPLIHQEPYKKLRADSENIKFLKEQILKENRAPTDEEVAKIGQYNAQMMKKVKKMTAEVFHANPTLRIRKMTQIEKGHIAMNYIRMHEDPN